MKKFAATLLAVVLALSLTACGGTNVDTLSKNYNDLQTKYNSMADVVEANGWNMSDDVYYPMEEIAATINQYGDAIANPSKYKQEDVDQMAQKCQELMDWVDEMMPLVSEPYNP